MEKIEEINRFLKQIKKARIDIKYNRKNFWSKNSVNFKNNLKTILLVFTFPKKWRISTIASRFLLDRHTMPYDKDVWSFSDVVGATAKQGHDIVLFFNKTDLEFLSAPALVPIIIHEVAHVFQATQNPKKYVQATVDDKMNRRYEEEAEAEVRKYSDEFRKENVLEKIMYCFDEEGWEGAKKIINYLYYESQNAFGGGYDQDMKKEEFEAFQKAERERDIDIFIDYFIKSFSE